MGIVAIITIMVWEFITAMPAPPIDAMRHQAKSMAGHLFHPDLVVASPSRQPLSIRLQENDHATPIESEG